MGNVLTATHYLKYVQDAIFDDDRFIIQRPAWCSNPHWLTTDEVYAFRGRNKQTNDIKDHGPGAIDTVCVIKTTKFGNSFDYFRHCGASKEWRIWLNAGAPPTPAYCKMLFQNYLDDVKPIRDIVIQDDKPKPKTKIGRKALLAALLLSQRSA